MYIYRYDEGTNGFGVVNLIPVEFYKFWDGVVDTTTTPNYSKPLQPLPVIDWEINIVADEWRQRVSLMDPQNPISIAKLREIPDSYIESFMFNIIYGYNMNYNNGKALYIPSRIGDTFVVTPLVWPSLFFAITAIATLVTEYQNDATPVTLAQSDQLRTLLRHVTYVSTATVAQFLEIKPTGQTVIHAMTSKLAKRQDHLYYDRVATEAWYAKGGSEPLLAADWAINLHVADDSTIEQADDLLLAWKNLTDVTKP